MLKVKFSNHVKLFNEHRVMTSMPHDYYLCPKCYSFIFHLWKTNF